MNYLDLPSSWEKARRSVHKYSHKPDANFTAAAPGSRSPRAGRRQHGAPLKGLRVLRARPVERIALRRSLVEGRVHGRRSAMAGDMARISGSVRSVGVTDAAGMGINAKGDALPRIGRRPRG